VFTERGTGFNAISTGFSAENGFTGKETVSPGGELCLPADTGFPARKESLPAVAGCYWYLGQRAAACSGKF